MADWLPAALLLALPGLVLWWLFRERPAPRVAPLDEDTAQALARRIPAAMAMDAAQRERWRLQVAQFLAGKDFYGCNGLAVTHEMALVIAGMACLLTVREDAPPYPALRSVLVYPDAFVVRDPEPDELGLVDEAGRELAGESWDGQRIIVSWADVEAALDGAPDNVVVHECAHQLDDMAPQAEGAPPMADYRRWSAVMRAEFQALSRRPSPVIDDYGRSSPAEFFAVCVESYVQRGAELARHHPALYALLRDYFGIDTARA